MFEQEIELEQKEGSNWGPFLMIVLLIGLFVGGIGVVIFQSKQTVKPEEATAAVQARVKALGPVTVSFHIGMVSYNGPDKPSDPQYKLLTNAGLLKVGKGKGYAALVELTPQGKELLSTIPGVQTTADKNDTTLYVVPLATRKMVSVGNITKLAQGRFQVSYTWQWVTTPAGEFFDVNGKYVQALSLYERSVLIDQHGANSYHSGASQASFVLAKGAKGWEPAAS
jgi:hypothetical protein